MDHCPEARKGEMAADNIDNAMDRGNSLRNMPQGIPRTWRNVMMHHCATSLIQPIDHLYVCKVSKDFVLRKSTIVWPEQESASTSITLDSFLFLSLSSSIAIAATTPSPPDDDNGP